MVNIIGTICLLYIFSWCFVVFDNLIDDIIDFVKYKVLKIKNEPRSYSSVKEMILKHGKFRELYLDVYRFFNHIKEFPDDSYYNIKYFIQRGRNGYSTRDIWSFDYYLSDIIIYGLKELKKVTHGYPSGMIGIKSIATEDNDRGLKEWKNILDKIIWTFEISKKIRGQRWSYCPLTKDRKKYEKWAKKRKIHLMNKKECDRYQSGWKLFKKYYFDLYD